MTPADLLRVENLSVDFATGEGRIHAVRNVSWSVGPGETLAIIGESGSGKSVSAASVLGLIDCPPGIIAGGKVLFEGQDLLTLTQRQRRKVNGVRIAMIFQDPLTGLNPVYSIGWQIAEAMRAHGTSSGEAAAKAVTLLERVGIQHAARRAGDYPHEFSGGQRQRIMIAMAIAMRPALLLADEPTSALDVTVQAQILALLKDLQAETGMGMVLITHNIQVARQMADRVVVMQAGEVVEAGPVGKVLTTPESAYTKMLLASVPGSGTISDADVRTGSAQPLCEVRGLTKIYRGRRSILGRRIVPDVAAVDDVSLDIYANEIVCLVGESGSGKSTLVKTLLRLDTADSGKVLFRGEDVFAMREAAVQKFRRDVQIVFQDPTSSLNPRMTIGELISEPWVIHHGLVEKRDRERQAGLLLERVGLKAEHTRRYPHEFSGGQRQRVAIARALALQPKMIVCDEAVSALDVSVQAKVLDLLRKLKDESGLALLFITHDLGLVRDFADRVIVMHNGRIVEEGRVRQIFEAPRHDYTRELLRAHAGIAPEHV